MASKDDVKQFENDGYLVIENFLTETEIAGLKSECHKLIDDMDPKEHDTIFKTDDSRGEYFLTSGDKIRFFYEDGVLDENGKLAVEKHLAINKIGHALHVYAPAFREVTFSTKVKNLAQSLGLVDPVIPQSMYIFKQPKIGGKVGAHQDSTYLRTDPMKVTGFWIALEDVTLENSCLHFIPGSHKEGVHNDYRMIRNPDWDKGLSYKTCIFENSPREYDENDFFPVEVKRGTLVLIHGEVVHKSEENRSLKSRHIYTFHLFDQYECQWSSKNWLQPTEALPFPHLYTFPVKA